jgi:Asp-tRNA(Asn)/Glu-tRNA(Gln) amidotransferase B subunit
MTEVEAVDWLFDYHREIVENYRKFPAGGLFGLLLGKAMQHANGKLDARLLNAELARRLDGLKGT